MVCWHKLSLKTQTELIESLYTLEDAERHRKFAISAAAAILEREQRQPTKVKS